MFIISVNDRLSVKPTRELAAKVAIDAVQKEIDDYRLTHGEQAWSMEELEETVAVLQRWSDGVIGNGLISNALCHRVYATLNHLGPGLRITASYLSSGSMRVIIQAEEA